MSTQSIKILRSNVEGKTPEPSQMEYGNLAMNFNANEPFLSIKTDDDKIVKFPSESGVESLVEEKVPEVVEDKMSDYYNKTEVDTKLADKSDTGHTHSYNDLEDKPTIPSIEGLAKTSDVNAELAKKSDTGHTHSYNSLTDKPTIPTKVSELTNDKGYITEHQDLSAYAKQEDVTDALDSKANKSDTYTKSEVDTSLNNKANTATTYSKEEVNNLINSLSSLNLAVVDSLPTTDIKDTTIYLIKANAESTDNVYTEYLYVNGAWEIIGSTAADLSPYLKSEDAAKTYQPKGDYLTGFTESDPIFEASPAASIKSTDITAWNNKSDFSGSYNDLTDKPTIPSIEGLETSEHASETYQAKGDYALKSEIPNVDDYITDDDVAEAIKDCLQLNSAFSNPNNVTPTLYQNGLKFNSTTGALMPENMAASHAQMSNNYAWVGVGTMKNYIDSLNVVTTASTLTMTATLEDGTTKTYTVYGQEA